MDTEKQHTKAFKPEIGRGCFFCNCGSECEAKLCDGCFKLHETAWLEEYPENLPTDIVEVRFKNTRRAFYQNVNNLPLKRKQGQDQDFGRSVRSDQQDDRT